MLTEVHAMARLIVVALLLCLPAAVPAAAPQAGGSGESIYLRHCARCHQSDGNGIDDLYPGLRDLPAAGAPRREAIRGLLAGRLGELEVGGVTLDNPMPGHGFLGNETLAAALTYVLTEWSDAGEPVTAEEVAEVRLDLLRGHPAPTEAVTGESPLADLDAAQYVTSDGPFMTVDEFERARRLYYGRCTGCHGVLREGVAGSPLTPALMRERGTAYLQSVIGFGAASGMPAWGTSGEMAAEDIEMLARYLQHPVPVPPDMDLVQIRDGWHLRRTPGERSAAPRHDYDIDRMFVATLHDVGQIALFDGVGKSLIARVDVGRAPHRVSASASGRYLYVVGRDGTVSLVDLFAAPPETVASVRIGYEARSVAASAHPDYADRFALAGAYWPPQLVLLDGRTLEPLRLVSTRGFADGRRYHPEPRVSDVAGSPLHPEFVGHVKETGRTYLFPYADGADGLLKLEDLDASPELRGGSASVDGRYYLTPTDGDAISVVDLAAREVIAEIPARAFGGNPGTSYVHDTLGPVWLTSTMVDRDLIVVGTDPERHPEQAWRVLQYVPGPASGSLFTATHRASRHLWMDTPLNAEAELSQSVTVFDKHALEGGYERLPVARWSGLRQGPRRVIQPSYSPDGAEVWMLVWNPQDQGSAVVVVDDASLEPIATIRDPALVTPTRLYNVGVLRGATPETAPSAATGARLYTQHCANCHGTYGEGDGPMAPSLATALKDLRYLSARNDGEFPASFVRDIIDGRAARTAHGPADMPVWGAELARDGDAATAAARIDTLVRFLEAVQK
jgi:nitrite reductase (NO-forming)/hydroxylamine reductase